jgi:Flp pilus assembly protein TadD
VAEPSPEWVTRNLARGDYATALTVADRAVALAPNDPWARYHRAVALHHLGHTDAAVAAYGEAEQRFGGRRGQAISIYGRARALDDAGRCQEAKAAYAEYASVVAAEGASQARMAIEYAKDCRPAEPGRERGDLAMTELSSAIIEGRYAEALSLADRVPEPARSTAWFDYDRAVALAHLGRTGEAVTAYQRAEQKFGEQTGEDAHGAGAAMAAYGRARALADTGRP